MVRKRSTEQLEKLTVAATSVFLSRGFKRTHMSQIASEAGVAAGTLYLYFENKDSLFLYVLRRAFLEGPAKRKELPLKSVETDDVLGFVRQQLRQHTRLPSLEKAEESLISRSESELEQILRELINSIRSLRTGILLLQRCAVDWPQLFEVYMDEVRHGLLNRLKHFLQQGASERSLVTTPDPETAATVLLQTASWFAINERKSRESHEDANEAINTVVMMLSRSLRPDP